MNMPLPHRADTAAPRPVVSVVIPARNALATLGQTLASLRGQNTDDWEAIVVDDGSSDRTAGLVQRHAAVDPRIRCIAGPRRGVSAARNAGIAVARGELVAFLDADDLWLPNKLRAHIDHMTRAPQVGVSFDRILFVDVKGRSTGVESTTRVQGLARHEFLYENPASTASTLVVRRQVLTQVGGFDEGMRFAEDLELMVRIRCTTEWGVQGLGEVLTHYRASPTGASSSLAAMQYGWEALIDKVRAYAPAMVEAHVTSARAVHLRYLARRAVRLGLPAAVGLKLFAQAASTGPLALLREPRRTFGTLAALLAHAVAGLVLRMQRN